MSLASNLQKFIKGEVKTDSAILNQYSTDASLFKVAPKAVVFPKDAEDIMALVRFVSAHKAEDTALSLTARAAGSDMSGGPLNESIIVGFTEHMNRFSLDMQTRTARVEPGALYRDFEKETLKHKLLLPSYPASKSLAALGGMIANNGAGEMTLRYGKTADYVREMKVVLSDGNEYAFRKLTKQELEQKKQQSDFEGDIYRKMYDLLETHYDAIQSARPDVAKNSAGYALWDVWDREHFDFTRLFSGAQGTLGIMTEATLELVKIKEHKKLAVLFLRDLKQVSALVNALLPLEPEALETFDDNTLKLALRFFPSIARKVNGENVFSFFFKFIPEGLIVAKMLRIPELIILAQFAEDSEEEAEGKLTRLKEVLKKFDIEKRILHSPKDFEKYWVIRRESFALLREHVKGKRTAPFIDDLIVKPEHLPDVLPKIHRILKQYGIKETIAGHAGSGNLHIIPLMDLSKEKEKQKIPIVSQKVYDIILQYKGSITAEHNDGLIRSPYLEKMYGEKVYNIFRETKKIFDPQNIFNPGKKVGSSLDYAMNHIDHK